MTLFHQGMYVQQIKVENRSITTMRLQLREMKSLGEKRTNCPIMRKNVTFT